MCIIPRHSNRHIPNGASPPIGQVMAAAMDWNGTSFLPKPTPSIHAFSDASGVGLRVFAESAGWSQIQWPLRWATVDITAKELLPIVIATAMWGHQWQNEHVCFHCDNMAVVAILRSHTGRGEIVGHLLHCFFLYVAIHNLLYSVVHIPGTAIIAADALSRDNLPLFCSLYPQVPRQDIPQSLMDLLVTDMPDWGSNHWIALFRRSLREVWPAPQSLPTGQGNIVT